MTGMIEPACAKCGACAAVCPVYAVTGRESLTARGKIHLLQSLPEKERTAVYGDILSSCLLCGACQDVCPAGLQPPARIIAARRQLSRKTGKRVFLNYLARQAVSHPAWLSTLLAGGSAVNALFATRLPEKSGLRLKLAALDLGARRPPAAAYMATRRPAIGGSAGVMPQYAYFVGCLANYFYPEIGAATETLLTGRLFGESRGAPPFVPQEQACCGQALLAAGDLDEARRLARINIAAFETTELPILTSCASCYHQLLHYPDLFPAESVWRQRAVKFAGRLREFSTLFDEVCAVHGRSFFSETAGGKRVFYHDPCHLRFGVHVTEPPRRLLAGLPGLDLVELPHGPQCCGHGGLFSLAHPGLAARISERLLQDFSLLTVDLVTTTCSGCLLQWQQNLATGHSRTQVKHLAVLLAECLA